MSTIIFEQILFIKKLNTWQLYLSKYGKSTSAKLSEKDAKNIIRQYNLTRRETSETIIYN